MLTASRDQQIIIKQRAQWSSESATAAADQVCQNVTEGSEAAEALCAEPLSIESVTAAADQVCQNATEGSEAAEALCAEPLSSESMTAAADQVCRNEGNEAAIILGARHARKKKKSCRRDGKVVRIQKMKLRRLRMLMTSFEAPEKPIIFRRVIPPSETSDEEDGNDIDIDVGSQQKSRKRHRNKNLWKRNKIKRAREKGEYYVSYTGEVIEAKSAPLREVLCRCKFKCNDGLSDNQRLLIFNAYYNLSTEAKNTYLFGCLQTGSPKYLFANATRHRDVAVKYTVNNGCKTIRVCKKAFMRLHAISQSKVDHIVGQAKQGIPTARPSKRGMHSNRPNRLPESRRELVREHIRLFPSEMSHYSRHENPNRRYLPATLSVNKMYVEYVAWAEEKGELPVTSSMYRSIFTSDFNLGFGCPRTDTCSKCETLQSTDLDKHKRAAAAAFEQQASDRQTARADSSAVYITFDLEKTLPLPRLSCGDAFYLRQLWLYNAGVHLISKKKEGAYFHIWTENEAHRGAKEICSAVLAFLESSEVCGVDKTLVAWTDSCSGQNKNFQMLCFWQYLLLTNRFKVIEHKFPIPGHSFMDCDRDFAKIEVATRQRQHVYTIDEYQSLMMNSIRKPKPTVTRMADKMFDIQELIRQLGLVQKTVDRSGRKIAMRDNVRWIRMTQFGTYHYRHSFSSDEPWKEVVIRGPARLQPDCQMDIKLLPVANLPITAAKLRDINKQLKFIPTQYQSLYRQLTSAAVSSCPDGDGDGEDDVEPECLEVYFEFL